MEAPNQTAAYFDTEAGGWSDRYRGNRHFRARLETVLNWLKDLPPGAEILDYGCGSGVLLRELAMTGYRVGGVDVSEGMLDVARQSLREFGPVDLERVGDDYRGAYLERRYDAVVSLGVVEYLDKPYDLLEKLAGVVKPGGMLVLSFPNRDSVLRKIEGVIFRNPAPFKALNLFAHLTGPDSYLHFQKHQFRVAEVVSFLKPFGLRQTRVHHHVAPKSLGLLENAPAFAMTAIAAFHKT